MDCIFQITYLIKNIINNCNICIIHKLNKFMKSANIQIISKYPLERIQIDIIYFKNKFELAELENKYLLNFIEHFSKYAKGYLVNNKESDIVISKLKNYIKEIGKPIIGEFKSNKFKLFCLDNKIKLINGGIKHPRSQGVVKTFNKNIIYKLQYIKLEEKHNFDINSALVKAYKIYNHTIHSVIKLEPFKAIKLTNKKKLIELQKILLNLKLIIIIVITIKKGSKVLLCNNYNKSGKILNIKTFGKNFIIIPIIIDSSIVGTKYKYKVVKNIKNLKANVLYEVNYKLIKFCSEKM